MTAAYRSDAELVVLHTLRCCGVSSLQRVADVVAWLLPIDVEEVLLDLAAQGLVGHGGGTFGGWGLTDAGRTADADRITVELDVAGARAQVRSAYDEFLPLNQRTLDICGAWQVRSMGPPLVLNDHSEAAYDEGVLRQLAAVDRAAQPVCALVAERLHRFSHYGPRLASALERARNGEPDLVTDSLDSYHSVWFQLHEDLMVSLGMGRGD